MKHLSSGIGDFIRYWGFRRVHGEIWTQVYLSEVPLSCTDLVERLELSKALISPAIEELVDFGLLLDAPSPNSKTKLYQANEDVNKVIQDVLRRRELPMLKKISYDFDALKKSNLSDAQISSRRLESLGEMILSAQLMLQIMIAQEDLMNLPKEFS